MDKIEVLDAIAAIRKRPSMYVGNPDSPDAATTTMLLEPLCFAVNEPGGPASNVFVTVRADGSASISNDGPGIPTEVDPRNGESLLDSLMTKLFACRELKSEHEDPVWCRYGVTITNALSRWCTVVVTRNGRQVERRYEFGRPVGALRDLGARPESGTTLSFEPDQTIVSAIFDSESISRRLAEFASVFPCVAVEFVDQRRPDPVVLRRSAKSAWD